MRGDSPEVTENNIGGTRVPTRDILCSRLLIELLYRIPTLMQEFRVRYHAALRTYVCTCGIGGYEAIYYIYVSANMIGAKGSPVEL